MKILADGLAADAWTGLDQATQTSAAPAPQPLSRQELARILAAPLPPGEKIDNRQ